MLPASAVTAIAAGLGEYANGSLGALPNPQFEIIYEYAPKNGPKALDFNLVHESVWRGWDSDRQLPERVGPVEILGLATASARDWLPQQERDARFTILAFALMYDESLNPCTGKIGDGILDPAVTRVVIAVDTDCRRYELLLGGGRASGPVQVSAPAAPLSDASSPLLSNRRAATAALIGIVEVAAAIAGSAPDAAADRDNAEEADELVAGELVTVTGDRFDDDDRRYLWVVVDHFDDYTIAVLGGDGYQWPRIPRGELIPVAPRCIRRVVRTDDTFGYRATDSLEPDPVR